MAEVLGWLVLAVVLARMAWVAHRRSIDDKQDKANTRELVQQLNEAAIRFETHIRRAAHTASKSEGILRYLATSVNHARPWVGDETETNLIDAVVVTTTQFEEFHEAIAAIRSDVVDLLTLVGMKVRVTDGETESTDA